MKVGRVMLKHRKGGLSASGGGLPITNPSDTADYVKHRLHSKLGERCFSYAGPAAWNSLPHSIKLTTDTNRFKHLLKSHLFHIAF